MVSRFDPDPPRELVVYVPLTTQNRNSLYWVEMPRLGFLHAISGANVQGIASIPAIRLERKLGTLTDATMAVVVLQAFEIKQKVELNSSRARYPR